jgi:hypothetical protein
MTDSIKQLKYFLQLRKAAKLENFSVESILKADFEVMNPLLKRFVSNFGWAACSGNGECQL